MILKSLKIYSQNVCKNKLLADTLLENKDFDILFIQEPFWSIIYNIPSFLSKEGDKIIDALNCLL